MPPTIDRESSPTWLADEGSTFLASIQTGLEDLPHFSVDDYPNPVNSVPRLKGG